MGDCVCAEVLCWSRVCSSVVMVWWDAWLVGRGEISYLPWVKISGDSCRTNLYGDLHTSVTSGLVRGGGVTARRGYPSRWRKAVGLPS